MAEKDGGVFSPPSFSGTDQSTSDGCAILRKS